MVDDTQNRKSRVEGAIANACHACREAGCDNEAALIESMADSHPEYSHSLMYDRLTTIARTVFDWADRDAVRGRLGEALTFERAGLALRSAAWFVAEAIADDSA